MRGLNRIAIECATPESWDRVLFRIGLFETAVDWFYFKEESYIGLVYNGMMVFGLDQLVKYQAQGLGYHVISSEHYLERTLRRNDEYAASDCLSCGKPSFKYKYCSGHCHDRSDHVSKRREIACPVCERNGKFWQSVEEHLLPKIKRSGL